MCKGDQEQNTCAHSATKKLTQLGINWNFGTGGHQRTQKKYGMCVCQCGLPLRARQVGQWYASKSAPVTKYENNRTYLIWQSRAKDGRHHVYVYHNGSNYGNGNYTWPQDSLEDGKGAVTTKGFLAK